MSIPCRWKLSCAEISFLMPARNYKAQSGLAIKIEIYIEYSAIWLVNVKNKMSKCIAKFHPEERATFGYTMKTSSMYHRLLIYDVK